MKYRFVLIAALMLALAAILSPAPAAPAHAADAPMVDAQPAQDCPVDLEAPRARYELAARLDWNTKVMAVQQTVTYRNDFDQPLEELVFHSEPHRQSNVNAMTFGTAYTSGGAPIQGVTTEAMRMTVPLPQPAAPGCDVTIRLDYDINITPLGDTNVLGWLAYTERQLNLGNWYPTVALYDYQTPGEWYTPTRHYIGEQAVPEYANHKLTLTVNNAPAGLQLAGPGQVDQAGTTWVVTLHGARELAVSLSTQFTKTTATAGNVEVELYTFPTSSQATIDRALADAVNAVTLYSDLFGDYPHERLVVVEGDFADGYEFSGLVFVSQRWFEIWNGTPLHWLTIITVHEIAHQWWFISVGSNQGETPYLDEAMATYSEYLYYEEFFPELAAEWWDFRVNRHEVGSDPVDVTVHEFTQWRPYINAVYLRGVQMLRDIRAAAGDEAFFAWLNDYATANAGQIAAPADFWGAMPAEVYTATAAVREQYLRNPNVLSQ